MEKFKSFYPPTCVQGPVSGRWYIIANGKWIEVSRQYSWNELEKLWIKETIQPKPETPKRKPNGEWHYVGSKGEIYEVKSDDDFWTCNCPAHAFGRGRDCKHIIDVKANNKKRNRYDTTRNR
jgi:predicted heme/steroid binding protein